MEERHYDDLEWIEYLKGRAGEKASEMASHAESCESCRIWLSTCQELMHVFSAETASPDSSHWVRDAVAGFEPGTDTPVPGEVFAGLTSDTYLNTPVGVRAALASERRVSFESDDYFLEMTSEVSQRTLKRVYGHLLQKADRTPAEGVAAELAVSSKTYSARTNASGEFYFSLDEKLTGDPVEIRFRFGENPCLTALLPF